jgi:hypothetical protein
MSDFMCECFVYEVWRESSSTDAEKAQRHHATNAQCRARLEEIGEARRQLDEELTNLH